MSEGQKCTHNHQSVCLDDEFKTKIINGLLTCQGHISAIAKMVSAGKNCEEVLLQISAVDSALKKIGKMMLRNHLEHCVKDSVASGDTDSLSDFGKLLDRYLNV